MSIHCSRVILVAAGSLQEPTAGRAADLLHKTDEVKALSARLLTEAEEQQGIQPVTHAP